jgi:hypothetical protein
LGGQYVLAENIDIAIAVGENGVYDSTVFGNFFGTLDGANKTISGLTKPLFAGIYAAPNETIEDVTVNTIEIKNLNLETHLSGVNGHGALANMSNTGSDIENVSVSGSVGILNNNVGAIVGESYGSITNSSSKGSVNSNGNYVGGLAGVAVGNILNSNSTSNVTSTGSHVGGLIGQLTGNIQSSFSSGVVTSSGGYVGGLVGKLEGDISNSHSTSTVNVNSQSAIQYVGGLAGHASHFLIENSYSAGNVTTISAIDIAAPGGPIGTIGSSNVSGFIGYSFNGDIKDSHSLGNVTVNTSASGQGLFEGFNAGNSSIAGFLGSSYDVKIERATSEGNVISISDVLINGDVNGGASVTSTSIGGLIGYAGCSNRCLSEELLINQVTAKGNIQSSVSADLQVIHGNLAVYNEYVGKLIGNSENVKIEQSIGMGSITTEKSQSTFNTPVSLFFYNQNIGGTIGFEGLGTTFIASEELAPSNSMITTLSRIGSPGQGKWSTTSGCNSGLPFLVELSTRYAPICQQASSESNSPRVRKVVQYLQILTPEKIEKVIGFKNEAPLPTTAPISFIASSEKFDVSKLNAVEMTPTSNARVSAKAGEALQISLKSESKESVELWVKSPDGKWLLAGVITFDKDGKAVLPPLQFKNAGDYTLVLNKPSAGSEKGSEPLNQSGSLLVEVI